MEALPFLFALLLVVAIAAAWLGWRADRQRTRALREFAQSLGFDFDASDDASHDEQYAQFAIFRRGDSRVAQKTLRGALTLFERACDVVLGDFRYEETSGTGKSSTTTTYRFSYLIVHPPWPSPSLLVRPEGLFDKIKGAFGFDDIDFESEEFSRKYFVQSDDKRFAYDVLHPRMIEFLLAEAPPALDLERGALCISDGRRRWSPAEFRTRLEFARRFCELWPRHLVQSLET